MEPETVRTGAGKCLEILTDYCTQLRLFVVGFFCLFQSRLLLLLAERSFYVEKSNPQSYVTSFNDCDGRRIIAVNAN